ncbi:hypothetical protein R5R35_006397 [Gryllus longicercus]|uniref:Ammonium transporter AmtB-like domain-containing protein n=1 Tax=Gryllus longicercus TaxID=2509291 RepID=A0AAN9W9Y8_9ORTH
MGGRGGGRAGAVGVLSTGVPQVSVCAAADVLALWVCGRGGCARRRTRWRCGRPEHGRAAGVGVRGGGRAGAEGVLSTGVRQVSVCAAADVLALWAALVAGVGAGALYLALRSVVWRCGVDDPLDVVAVHGGGGAWGLLAASLFAGDGTGVALNPSPEALQALLWRVAGGAAICAWALVCALVLFGALRLLGLLRVSADEELRGLDEAVHGEAGYPAEGWAGGAVPPFGASAGALNHPHGGGRAPRLDTFRALADYHNAAFEDGERPPARR